MKNLYTLLMGCSMLFGSQQTNTINVRRDDIMLIGAYGALAVTLPVIVLGQAIIFDWDEDNSIERANELRSIFFLATFPISAFAAYKVYSILRK